MSRTVPAGSERAWVPPPEGWTPPAPGAGTGAGVRIPAAAVAALLALVLVLQLAGLAVASAHPGDWSLAAALLDAVDELGQPTPDRPRPRAGPRGTERKGPPHWVDREWAERALPEAGDLGGDWRGTERSSGPRQGALADIFSYEDDRVASCELVVRAGTEGETAVAETNLRSEAGGLVVGIVAVYADDADAAGDFEVLSGRRYLDCLRESFQVSSRAAAERVGIGIGPAGAEPMDAPVGGEDVAAVRVVAELAAPEGANAGAEVVVVRRGRAVALVARTTAVEGPAIGELATALAERMGEGPPPA